MDSRSLYEEAQIALIASEFIYLFVNIVSEGRNGKLTLPDGLLDDYKDQRLDVRGKTGDGKHGIPLSTVMKVLRDNKTALEHILTEYTRGTFIKNLFPLLEAAEAKQEGDSLFLETLSSFEGTVQCVYGVVKSVDTKSLYVVFRGSNNNNDWLHNLRAYGTNLDTPSVLKPVLEDSLKDNVRVHEGFYKYLFDNDKAKGEQRFDMILGDIQNFAEQGYKIYVCGHSLGGALASLTAFKLAGKKSSWVPKPIRCITYASPLVGSSDFLTAFTQLEKMNMIKYLRITNSLDPVPTVPPFSLGLWNKFMYYHVGINLRLEEDPDNYKLTHPSHGADFWRTLDNSILKPVWRVLTTHLLPYYMDRMTEQQNVLESMKIDELYENPHVVGEGFLLK